MDTKLCTKCHQEKPATPEFFYRRGGRKWEKLRSECKACKDAYDRAIDRERRAAYWENQRIASPVSSSDVQWLAGFIDGEGHIGAVIDRNTNERPFIEAWLSIDNTDPAKLRRARNAFRNLGETTWIVTRRVKNPRYSQSWRICVKGMRRLRRLLPKLIPNLTGKTKLVASVVLRLCEVRLDHERVFVGIGPGTTKCYTKSINDEERQLLSEIQELHQRGARTPHDHARALRTKASIAGTNELEGVDAIQHR